MNVFFDVPIKKFPDTLKYKMVNLPTLSTSHFGNSHFVNNDQMGIDKVRIDKVGR